MMKDAVPAGEAQGSQTETEEMGFDAEDGRGEAVIEPEDEFPGDVDEVSGDAAVVDGVRNDAEPGEGEDAVDDAGDADVIALLREELAAARAQADEYRDQMQRTAAEFQNARRRQEKQLSDAIDRANASLIRRLLPVLDDFELAFQNAPQAAEAEGVDDCEGEGEQQAADQAWVEGFRRIRKKLLDLLADEGVTPIDASGEFDPMRHEAVLSEESEEIESGHVVGVLRSGYEYKGQVLRPAMVRVAA